MSATIQAPAILDRIVAAIHSHWVVAGSDHLPRRVYCNPRDWDAIAAYYRLARPGRKVAFPSLRVETDYGDVTVTSSQFQAPGKFTITKG